MNQNVSSGTRLRHVLAAPPHSTNEARAAGTGTRVRCSLVIGSTLASFIACAQSSVIESRIESEQETGRRYVDSYFGKRWEALRALACANLAFDDPAGVVLFNSSPATHEGADVVVAAMRQGLGPLDLSYAESSVIASVGEWRSIGMLTWTMPLDGESITSTVPMAVELSLGTQDGRPCVARHRDIVDYRPFLRDVKARRKSVGSEGG